MSVAHETTRLAARTPRRTFGTARLVEKDGRRVWAIEAAPSVMMRLRRLFQGTSRAGKAIHVADTLEVCRDLAWVCERWPLDIDPADHARDRARRHQDAETAIARILSSEYVPRAVSLAVEPRDYQLRAAELALATRGLLLADDVGLGKAQPLDACVLTPGGWKTMAELAVGDVVIDPDGGHANITGIYPQGEREVFRVTMADGQWTECCDEHLWTVQTPRDRIVGDQVRTLPLSKLRSSLHYRGPGTPGQRASRYFVPLTAAVEFDPAPPLPLDPYLLGILLGDGACSKGQTRVSVADPEILGFVRAALPSGVEARHMGRVDYRLSCGQLGGAPNPLLDALRELGVPGHRSWEKRVPWLARHGSPETRLEVLRGLMDSDGTCGKEGTATFTSVSPGLAHDVMELVQSLGGFVSQKQRVTGYTYRGEKRLGRPSITLNIRIAVCPFRCTRKAARWHKPYMARAIRSVVPVGKKPTQCIRVSSKRSLYVTDGYIVTHNTASAICVLADPSVRPALVVTLTHLPRQWEAELQKFAPQLRVHRIREGALYDLASWGGRRRRRPGQLELAGTGVHLPDVIVTSYSKLTKWADALAPIVRSVFFDEVQELRHSDSQRYGAATQIAQAADLRMGLSATPIYNFGGEIFSVLGALSPGQLGTWGEFAATWCGNEAADRKKASLKDPRAFGAWAREQGLMLRRTRTDVGRELPPITRAIHRVDCDERPLSEIQGRAAELAKIILAEGGPGVDKMNASGELDWRLRQATGLAKAPFVANFVRLLAESGEKVLVYAWHHAVYDLLEERLADLGVVRFTGEESTPQKAAALSKFLRVGDASTRVLLMSLRAGAGVDGLQHRCRTVVFAELDWSPGVHEQALGRVARDGQTEPVVGYYLVSDQGSDPIVADVLGVKTVQVEGLRDPDAAVLGAPQLDPHHVRRLAEQYLAAKESA